MAGEKSANSRELDQTPTWAVAGVCFAIIIISIVLEKILHKLGTWFTDKRKKALYEALDKVKAELMILGFISLILTFTQDYIAKICIPDNVANTMLPCPSKVDKVKSDDKDDKEIGRRLLSYAFEGRLLASVSKTTCKPGKVPLITTNGLHQIHILIFFLAVFHVLYSAATMALGKLKIRGWKAWEEETASPHYEFSADPSRFRLSHETSFVRAHSRFWTKMPIFFIIGCFFRQFFKSVIKSDYMTLRNGFISVHLAPGSKFNFQRYIKRSLEDDFKVVVGVSPVLWASCVVFLLVNVNGSRALFWASFIPLLIILAVGTKLQAILAQMAIEITERHAVVQGIPLVQTSDKYFWFGRPKLVLQLIHFALFQNAFQITYFLWLLYEKLNSCFKENITILSLKLSSGLIVLLLCSYSTLPLYALIAQMGSQMKKSIFDEQTSKALMNWHMAAKKKKGGRAGRSPTRTLGGDASPALSMSSASAHSSWNAPAATLHRFKTTGHSVLPIHDDDHAISDTEVESQTATAKLIVRVDYGDTSIETTEIHPSEEQHGSEDEFSFAKPASLQ